jgi:peptide/nickel transport system substrate-binding protein/oligopeptide transport system substrate-binding protein
MNSHKGKLLVLLLVSAFVSNAYSATPPKYGGIVKYAVSQRSISLDPIKILTFTEYYIASSIFDGLVRHGEGGTIIPCVASSWDISEDQKVYTFQISESAKFHNGKKVTASDVKYSWQRSLTNASSDVLAQSKLALISGASSYRSGKINDIPGLKVLDENSIEVSLDQDDSLFLESLTTPPTWIVSKKLVQREDFNQHPIGSGPFKCAQLTGTDGEILHLEAYEEYVLGRPFLDGIILIFTPDFETALLQFETDELDCLEVPNIEFGRLRNDPAWSSQLISVVDKQLVCIQINRKAFEKGILTDVLKYGIDVESILEMLYNQGTPLVSDYQPEKAKKLVTESQSKPIKLIVLNTDNDAVKIADRISFDLLKIGITVNITPLNRQEFQNSLNDKSYALALRILTLLSKDLSINLFVPLFYQNMNMLQKPELQNLSNSAQNGVLQFDDMYILHLK